MARMQDPESEAPTIKGTYRLVLRELPDGIVQAPPDVMGLLTYTKKYRNFHVMWKDAQGKFFSISSIATYQLSANQYSEKNIYYMVNDEISGKGISYDLSGESGTSPVTVKDGRIRFQFPLHDEPSAVFERDKLKATRQDEFVDHWEKVE
jgi:hypothetical protein